MARRARIYLMLQGPSGDIRGESEVVPMQGWIELDDWRWQLDAGSRHADRQAVQPSVLSIAKRMDRASTAMLQAMRRADVLTASLCMQDASLQDFDLTIKLDKVRITQYEMHTESDGLRMRVEERWTLDYDTVLFSYRPDHRTGTMQVALIRPPGSSTQAPAARDHREKAHAAQELP